ncbi:MAG: ankyrin repeat domain-containing protein [Candidatus Omnitrophica bacterium]|nr:ankyrin repeat domain-containing protein [Candidatus Omnitrophota bacterium]
MSKTVSISLFFILTCATMFSQKSFSANVSMQSIRFFEGGDEIAQDQDLYYTDNFPRSSSRYIYCQIDYKNHLYNSQEHNVNFVFQYYNPDGSFRGQSETYTAVYPEWPSSWAYHGWGWSDPGNWPIGTYTVKVLANGEYLGEKKFSIYNDSTSAGSEDGSSDYLYNAVLDDDIATLRDLLSKGADPNATNMFGMYALGTAASKGNLDMIKILLENGADINSQDDMMGWTPLISAANKGNNEAVKLLIDRGAIIDAADTAGYTALIYAATAGYKDTVELLVKSGADINYASGGYSPLISALDNGHTETAKVLIENGADPNSSTETGETPLILAAQKGNLAAVQVLLDYGADAEVKDNKGRTALAWAEFEQHENIIELLKKPGNLNINGDWEGVWTNPKGYIYLLKFSVNIKDPKNFETAFNWTLNASPEAQEQPKVGLKATEYLKGSYDSAKRTIFLEGYKEKDDHSIIGLDRYKLIVSLDGDTIKGTTENNGTWSGKFSANRIKSSDKNLIEKAKLLWQKAK